MHAPNAKSKVSILSQSNFLLLNVINVEGLIQAYLSILKALFWSKLYLNSVSFCVSLVSSKALRE
jgi:hypothetical protein